MMIISHLPGASTTLNYLSLSLSLSSLITSDMPWTQGTLCGMPEIRSVTSLEAIFLSEQTSSPYHSVFRQVLDTKYGLKRWQIGEIASKIGQLYYHY